MANRKGWDSLSPGYQKRLASKGVTPEQYNAGHVLKAARGHTREERPNYPERARNNGIESVVPDFDELDKDEQLQLSIMWQKGFMTRGAGEVKNPKRARGERIRRRASGEQMLARDRFLAWKQENGEPMDSEQWALFRTMYSASFSQG